MGGTASEEESLEGNRVPGVTGVEGIDKRRKETGRVVVGTQTA